MEPNPIPTTNTSVANETGILNRLSPRSVSQRYGIRTRAVNAWIAKRAVNPSPAIRIIALLNALVLVAIHPAAFANAKGASRIQNAVIQLPEVSPPQWNALVSTSSSSSGRR